MEFQEFPKMARLSREMIVTEKIDGTNAQVYIVGNPEGFYTAKHPDPLVIAEGTCGGEPAVIFAGSRSRFITPQDDNFGFAAWVRDHAQELFGLGFGRHFGEWWGAGIQRKYGMKDRRWSLFNVSRWCLHGQEPQRIPTADPRIEKYQEPLPECCGLVPVLHRGKFSTLQCDLVLDELRMGGSKAAPGFMKPEGIVVFHVAGNVGFKKTIEKDEEPKGAR
jgi:hypothetical protein